jgi:hypothetical protein
MKMDLDHEIKFKSATEGGGSGSCTGPFFKSTEWRDCIGADFDGDGWRDYIVWDEDQFDSSILSSSTIVFMNRNEIRKQVPFLGSGYSIPRYIYPNEKLKNGGISTEGLDGNYFLFAYDRKKGEMAIFNRNEVDAYSKEETKY